MRKEKGEKKKRQEREIKGLKKQMLNTHNPVHRFTYKANPKAKKKHGTSEDGVYLEISLELGDEESSNPK